MGAGASAATERSIIYWQKEAELPVDASDLNDDVDALKKEVSRLRQQIKEQVAIVKAKSSDSATLNDEVRKLMGKAAKAEESVTAFLQSIAADAGGELVGLSYKFKQFDSLRRKVTADLESARRKAKNDPTDQSEQVSITAIVESMGDALRYTMIIPDVKYVETVKKTRSMIVDSKVNKVKKMKNYWEAGDMYQGINDNYTLENGLTYEVQFHTPASWDLKSAAHVLYEKFRVSTDPLEQQRLFKEGTQLASTLIVPEGVLELPVMKVNQHPVLENAFAYQICRNCDELSKELKPWCQKLFPMGSVDVEADSESLIRTEISAIETVNDISFVNAIEEYFYGLRVSIVIPSAGYAQAVRSFLKLLLSSNAECGGCLTPSGRKLTLVRGSNNWEINDSILSHRGKDVQLLVIAGNRTEGDLAQNIRFEIVFNTPESKAKASEAAAVFTLRTVASKKKCDTIANMWKEVPIPPDILDLEGFSKGLYDERASGGRVWPEAYYRARKLADKHAKTRSSYLVASQVCFKEDRKKEASQLSAQGKREGLLMAEQNKIAVDVILSLQDFESSNTIDLHGLYVEEAKECLLDIVKKHQESEKFEMLIVITGSGNHSGERGAKIRPAFLAMAEEQKWTVEPHADNAGSFTLKLK